MNSFIHALYLAMALLIGCSAINPNPSQTAGGSGSSGSSGASGEGGEGADASGEAGRKNPVAVIEMQDGKKIEVELYPDIAPNTVNNFISLANSGFYDGVIFHRVIPGFMIQGGDPEGTGGGGPGYGIKGEFSNNDFPNGLKHTRGVISMARRGNPINPKPFYDTAGSQFFIMVADSPSLDNDYAAFGKAVSGMDVADAIVNTPTDSGDKPLSEQKIKTITVDTFGVDYPEPETISE